MMPTLNDRIRRGFSRSARKYDLFSSLHREIADELLAQVMNEAQPLNILDVGCGTGYLTVKLKDHFPACSIVGLDIAQGMLKQARLKNDGITWILGDSHHLPFLRESFDILISNLAYQWSIDLTQVFAQAKRVLTTEGILACTLFGYSTCQELFQSLDEATAGALQFSRLPRESQVRESLLASGFTKPQVSSELIKIEFRDMHELMTWLKSIGANHLAKEGFLGPDAVSRAASIYNEKFPYLDGVGATFEVIRVYAKE